jgi:hypothetical protein
VSAFVELPRHDPEALRRVIAGRRHYVGGPIGTTPFASVTTVLSATSGIDDSWAFRAWRSKHEAIQPGLADLARDVAADRGTKLHAEVTESLVTRRMPAAPDVWLRSMLPILRQWMAVARVALADGAVWHAMDRVAGTVDFVLWIGGGLWLIDVKTSAKPWDHARIRLALAQLGAYAECLRWTYDVELAGVGFVVALPDAEAQVRLSGPKSFSVEDAVTAWHERRQQYREQEGRRA